MFHLSAFAQSIDPANALTAITAVREETLFTNGVDLRVPTALPFLLGAGALGNDASFVRAQVQSPSLRMLANIDVEPIVPAATFGEPPEGLVHPYAPIPLAADEAVNFAVQSDPAAAQLHYGLILLGDGPQRSVEGQMFCLRCSSAIQQTTTTWVNGSLTFGQSLPAGRYQVIGLRARSADLVAARLVFPEQLARPGVIGVNGTSDEDLPIFRFGRMGVYGEFPHTNPPTIDVLGGVAAAQVYILDLIKVR